MSIQNQTEVFLPEEKGETVLMSFSQQGRRRQSMTLPFHTRETQAGFFVKESLFLRISLGDSPTTATETDACHLFYHTEDLFS